MITELVQALSELQEAQNAYNKAAENCRYDRDYFLHREIDRVKKAKENLENIFKQAVEEIVRNIKN